MSLQAQPQQQQPQQPVQVYPNTVTNQPSNSHHSNGSFGTVFVVLAIILVISTIACFLGRLCNRRYNKNQNQNQNHNHNHNQRPVKQNRQQIHNFHPREGDIEFGVDKRIPPSIPRPKGLVHGAAVTGPHGQSQANGNMKDFEMKPDHEGELRAGA